jgi:hypothetical protein
VSIGCVKLTTITAVVPARPISAARLLSDMLFYSPRSGAWPAASPPLPTLPLPPASNKPFPRP